MEMKLKHSSDKCDLHYGYRMCMLEMVDSMCRDSVDTQNQRVGRLYM